MFDENAIDHAKMYNAVVFGVLVVGTLSVSHLSMVCYIAYYDISGRWDAYSLKPQKNTVQTYMSHVPSFATDVYLILFPSLVIYGYFYDEWLWRPTISSDKKVTENLVSVCLVLLNACINNIINRLWAAAIHYVMHAFPVLYKNIHKKHHCPMKDLCALSAWQDSYTEFFFMEVFGVFLLASFFNPLPAYAHVCTAIYNGIGGAVDHSAFYIPDSIIDGRYHFDHHLLVTSNYAEMLTIDQLFGTLKVWKEDPPYMQSPRLQKNKSETKKMEAKKLVSPKRSSVDAF